MGSQVTGSPSGNSTICYDSGEKSYCSTMNGPLEEYNTTKIKPSNEEEEEDPLRSAPCWRKNHTAIHDSRDDGDRRRLTSELEQQRHFLLSNTTRRWKQQQANPPSLLASPQQQQFTTRRRIRRQHFGRISPLLVLCCSIIVALLTLPLLDARPTEGGGKYAMQNVIRNGMPVASLTLCDGSPDGSSWNVGLADFGHDLDDDTFEYKANLYSLPPRYSALCSAEDILRSNALNIPEGPKLAVGLLVDLGGDCDLLTKATNALLLQRLLHQEIKYVLFYSSDPYDPLKHDLRDFPSLSLDALFTEAPSEASNPPTFGPSAYPSSGSPSTPKPTGLPSQWQFNSNNQVEPTATEAPSEWQSNPNNNDQDWEQPVSTEAPSEVMEPPPPDNIFVPNIPTPAPTETTFPSQVPFASGAPSSKIPFLSTSPPISAPTNTIAPTTFLPTTSGPTATHNPTDTHFPTVTLYPTTPLPSWLEEGVFRERRDLSLKDPLTDERGNPIMADDVQRYPHSNIYRGREYRDDKDETHHWERERQRQDLEANDSMIFMVVSNSDKYLLLDVVETQKDKIKMSLNEIGKGVTLEEALLDNQLSMLGFCDDDNNRDDNRYNPPIPDNDYKRPPQRRPTPRPTRYENRYGTNSPTNTPTIGRGGRGGRNRDSYADNAPGSFTVFKFFLFGLLIASPCLRAIHLWWSGGGRIRFRRSEGDSNRVVGLQYIPPMDNWFGANEGTEGERPVQRLTREQVLGLPEITYRKPVFPSEEFKLSATKGKTIEPIEEEPTQQQQQQQFDNNKHNPHIYNEEDDNSDDDENSGSPIVTEVPSLLDPIESTDLNSTINSTMNSTMNSTINNTTMDGHQLFDSADEAESITSEQSFENEPSASAVATTTLAPIRLQLPTSPERVPSTLTSTTQDSDEDEEDVEPPMSPRAIHVKEELPPDEEQPEEQQLLPPPDPPSLDPPPEPPHLSFRTQRRLGSFTTTTCTSCSICLDDFEEGETLRLLPKCGHAFHTECILPWLTDRQGCCPLCKSPVLDEDASNNTNNNNSNSNSNSSNNAETNTNNANDGNAIL